MAESELKILINQGSTFRKVFTCTSGGTPIDLTGCTIEFKAVAEAFAPMVYTTTSGHIVLTSAEEGKFTITLSSSTTAEYTWTSAKFNIHATFSNGDVRRLIKGKLRLDKRV